MAEVPHILDIIPVGGYLYTFMYSLPIPTYCGGVTSSKDVHYLGLFRNYVGYVGSKNIIGLSISGIWNQTLPWIKMFWWET